MRRHSQSLTDAGISEQRLRELQALCRQYPEYVRQMRRERAGIVDRPPRRSGAWKRPDPTGNAAASLADRLAWMAARVKLIEESASRAASPAVARSIILNVSEGLSYDILRPPCGVRQFYESRQLFFMVLDELERQRFGLR